MNTDGLDKEKNKIIHQLEDAKQALQLSQLQKLGLQRALAKRIGTESRDVESLLASSNSSPRKLALVILKERESSRKRIQNLQDQLQDQLNLRARSELELRDVKLNQVEKQRLYRSENNRKEKTVSRLRQHVVDLENENEILMEENEERLSQIHALYEENHTHKVNTWEAAFAATASGKKKVDDGDGDQEDEKDYKNSVVQQLQYQIQQNQHQRRRRHRRQQRQLKRQLKQHLLFPSIQGTSSDNNKEHSSNTKIRKETMREREKRKRFERRRKQIKEEDKERKKYLKRVRQRENDLIKNNKIHRTGYAVGARAKRVPKKKKTWKDYMEKKDVPM